MKDERRERVIEEALREGVDLSGEDEEVLVDLMVDFPDIKPRTIRIVQERILLENAGIDPTLYLETMEQLAEEHGGVYREAYRDFLLDDLGGEGLEEYGRSRCWW